MNREIKFRIYHEDYGIYPVDKIEFDDEKVSFVYFTVPGIGDVEVEWEHVKKTTKVELLQSTGLLDKNGKEIYFGDILKWEEHRTHQGEVCEKIKDHIGYVPDEIRLERRGIPLDVHWDACEVVGDVYQNPELLK